MTLTFQKRSQIPCTANALYQWHGREGAFERLVPPWQSLRILSRDGSIETGSKIELELRRWGRSSRWIARIVDHGRNQFFEDRQESGPFAYWKHRHEFEANPGDESCWLTDTIEYRLPGGPLGRLFGGKFVASELERVFRFRHQITLTDLEEWNRYRDQPRLKVLVSGGHGFIGRNLVSFLRAQGNQVVALSRNPRAGDIGWDPENEEIDSEALEGFDVVCHLAGENLAAGRWTEKRKRSLWKSRIDSTRFLIDALARLKRPPKAFVCASGIGYYGDCGDGRVSELDARGEGFLAELCEAWEEAASRATRFANRSIQLRTGIVVDSGGGALGKMLLPFRLGVGGPLGTGRQWMSWIALEDWIRATHHLMRRGDSGVYNLVSPEPVTNRSFSKALANTLGRPAVARVPAPILTAALGEFAQEGLLSSCRAVPDRLSQTGFAFKYLNIGDAFRFTLGKH